MTLKQRYKLIVKKGPNSGHTYPIFAERITIGRDPMSDIIFKDPEVSRRHAQFVRMHDTYQVEDLGSTNGTFVNGERLSGESTLLKIGHEIALGGAVTLIFEEESAATDLEAVGTLDATMSAEEYESYPGTAESDDSFTDFTFDDSPGTSELDSDDVEDEDPDIDRLQSMPALPASRSSRSPQQQTPGLSNNPSQAPVKNVRIMTNQQIIYLVVGTVLTTIVCCGSLLLFMYFFGGDWLLNQF